MAAAVKGFFGIGGRGPRTSARAPARVAADAASREDELAYVKKHDTKTFKDSEPIYIVSASWINDWKKYVQDTSEEIPPPGPVDNHVLLDAEQNPLRGLYRGTDYRGVNERIWSRWVQTYGGGPEVVRKSVDIYDGAPAAVPDRSRDSRPEPRRRSVDPVSRAPGRNGGSMPPRPGGGAAAPTTLRSGGSQSALAKADAGRIPAEQGSDLGPRHLPPPAASRPVPEAYDSRGRTMDTHADRRSSAALRSKSTAEGGEYRAAQARKSTAPLVCDKCDGDHATDKCPHFRKEREKHISAWENYGKKGVVSGNIEVTYPAHECNVVAQPGDGSCLYHSLSYGLGNTNAGKLRKDIAHFVEKNPSFKIAETPLSDWVKYDSGASASDYASKMMYGSRWGGGIEIAACSQLYNVDVHVYQRNGKGYTRISSFNPGTKQPSKLLNLVYEGNCHYNYIDIRSR